MRRQYHGSYGFPMEFVSIVNFVCQTPENMENGWKRNIFHRKSGQSNTPIMQKGGYLPEFQFTNHKPANSAAIAVLSDHSKDD